MNLSSPAFKNNDMVPTNYTCKGQNNNPPLVIKNVPEATQSLAIICEDKDAAPKPWIHWFVYNIPSNTNKIADSHLPTGAIEGLANGGTPGYEGPCPKYFRGRHHYHFRLLALDIKTPTPTVLDSNQFLSTYSDHVIAESTLVGTAEGTGEAL